MAEVLEQIKGLENTLTKFTEVIEGKFKEHEGSQAEQTKALEEKLVAYQQENQEIKAAMNAIEASMKRAGSPASEIDEEIENYKEALDAYCRKGADALTYEQRSMLAQKTLSVGSQPDGGYLVNPSMSNKIITRVFETSAIRQLATVETINTDHMQFGIDDNELSALHVGELETRTTTSTPALGVKKIFAHELYAWPDVTLQMLEDSGIAIEPWLAKKIADKFARAQNTAFVSGSGVDRARGFLTYTAGTSTYARDTIEQVNNGHATVLQPDAFITLKGSVKELYQKNANWLMKRSTFTEACKLKDGSGQYLFGIGIGGMNNRQELQILGDPVNLADDMPAIASNALPVAYGDFKEGYTIVDRVGMTILRDPYSSSSGKVIFKARTRYGGDVTNFEAIKLLKMAV